jgi:hypothetical protein
MLKRASIGTGAAACSRVQSQGTVRYSGGHASNTSLRWLDTWHDSDEIGGFVLWNVITVGISNSSEVVSCCKDMGLCQGRKTEKVLMALSMHVSRKRSCKDVCVHERNSSSKLIFYGDY